MVLRKIALAPDQTRYGLKPGEAVRRVPTAGGLSRHRLDQLGAPSRMELGWMVDEEEHDYLLAFYRTAIAENGGRFLIDLIYDRLDLVEMEAVFLPGSMNLSAYAGETYNLTAKIELAPVARDAMADQTLIDSYATDVDGLEVMALIPSSRSYETSRGDDLLMDAPSLGPSRVRSGLPNNAIRVRVSWAVDADRYAYLFAFYMTATKEATKPFWCPLIVDEGAVQTRKALILPGTFTLSAVGGATHLVDAELEVAPIPRDETTDLATIAAFEVS